MENCLYCEVMLDSTGCLLASAIAITAVAAAVTCLCETKLTINREFYSYQASVSTVQLLLATPM